MAMNLDLHMSLGQGIEGDLLAYSSDCNLFCDSGRRGIGSTS
jgi:hypothetical protein